MKTVKVDTTNGTLQGSVDNGVCVFKGVRYAETTAGGNRYRPPQPVTKWAGVRDALTFGSSSPQHAMPQNTDPFFSWYSALQPLSEDCLFLNVFTPGTDGGKRPVMFWIHGGGWREFSGTGPGFNGTNLAREQDVTVVTINHRLNTFGFLKLDGSDERFADSGNAGLLDIVAALRWVRDNAAAFGGDPNNVTLFGQSGGASKIISLLDMPAAKGLFHKAIVQSTGAGLRICDQEESAGHASAFAKALGLEKLDGESLQKIPMDTLIAATKTTARPFRSVIDGRNFHEHPCDPVGPAMSADVPVMAGCTNMESTYYFRDNPKNFALEWSDIQRRLGRFLRLDEGATARLIDRYRTTYPNYNPSEIMMMVSSDQTFKRSTQRLATLQAASARVPVYYYLFDRNTPIEGGRMHSPHTTEIPFIFGTTNVAEAHVGKGSDIEPMTRVMMTTWATFARRGDPNNPTLPHWKPFTDSDRQTMVLNVESRLIRDPGGEARNALHDIPYFSYADSREPLMKD